MAHEDERAVGLPGLVLLLGGAAMVLVSFRYLHWYDVARHGADIADDGTFAALHASSDQLGGAGIATTYFGWLSWALIIGVVLVGALAVLPIRAAEPLRVLGFALGVVGAISTYYALAQQHNATGSRAAVLSHATYGTWCAIGGYALAGLGAATGPFRQKGTP